MGSDQRVDDVVAGLTEQERRVAAAVSAGRTNKATARELGVSVKTIEFHLGNVFRKLEVSSRGELAHLLHEAARIHPTESDATAVGRLPTVVAGIVGRDTTRSQ